MENPEEKLSYRNVAVYNTLGEYTRKGNWLTIDQFQTLAYRLGYKYYLWNDRVYKTNENPFNRTDTGLTIDDII